MLSQLIRAVKPRSQTPAYAPANAFDSYRTPDEVIRGRPAWVRRNIKGKELDVLRHWIDKTGATSGAEVGVASGYSSAFLISCMARNSAGPNLYSFDKSKECYFDNTRMTGDAFSEIHGTTEGFHLTTGITSENIPPLPPLDFLFIDGSHSTPWPAIDVLSLGRYLKPGGWIALDDVDMPLADRWQIGGKNGARDLFRAWKGPKLRYKGATNIAILYDVTPEIIARSVHDSLLVDWDVPVRDINRTNLRAVFNFYGTSWKKRFERQFKRQPKTSKVWQPVGFPNQP